MENELVSIIAPAYNHSQFIEKCIESVACQKYYNKELIIIDDYSKDDTANKIQSMISAKEVVDSFSGGIKFIKHKRNMGASYSINEGLKIARGTYLTIINTDDLYEPNRIGTMVEALLSSGSEICFSKVDTIDNNGDVLRTEEYEYYNFLQNKIEMYPLINLTLITDNVAVSTGNMLFTKKLYNKLGEFKDYKYIHDWDFILRACLETEPFYIDCTSYLYRLHNTNSFKSLKEDNQLCYDESMRVLTNFSKRIQTKNYVNKRIPSLEVWEYFINKIIKNKDLAHIWYNAKQIAKINCY